MQGLPTGFQRAWAQNHAAFPKGVDVLLGTPTHIVGLPRTTRIVNAVAEPQPQEA